MAIFGRRKRDIDSARQDGQAVADSGAGAIEAQMAREAERFRSAVGELIAPGAALDYSEASLATVDAFLERYHRGDLLWDGSLLMPTSAYVFEVIRRRFGGRYLASTADNPIVIVLGEPEFQLGVMVMGKITGRILNGDEDNLPFFYDGIAPLVAQKKSATLI